MRGFKIGYAIQQLWKPAFALSKNMQLYLGKSAAQEEGEKNQTLNHVLNY